MLVYGFDVQKIEKKMGWISFFARFDVPQHGDQGPGF
jgi:hypothetical protein